MIALRRAWIEEQQGDRKARIKNDGGKIYTIRLQRLGRKVGVGNEEYVWDNRSFALNQVSKEFDLLGKVSGTEIQLMDGRMFFLLFFRSYILLEMGIRII